MKQTNINIDEIKRYPTVTCPILADDLHTPQAYAYTLRRAIVTDCNDRQRAELVELLDGKDTAEGVTFNNTRVNRDRLHIWQNSESRKERAAMLGEGWEYVSGLHHHTKPGDLVTCIDGTRGRVTKSDPESCVIEFETEDGRRLSVAGYFRYTPSEKLRNSESKNRVNNNERAELRRAERLASDCEAATLKSEQDIREQTDRWTDIRTGDRVWCKHYKTMGTVTDVVTYYGSLHYHVSYDAPVRTTDRQGYPKEVSDTKGGLGYLRCGITKNYDEQGEREGTALYYAEQLRYGICNSYDFVFGAVRIKTKGTHNNLKNDNKNGWGVIYEVEISDGLGEAATYTMDIMQAANLLATLYAQDKGTDPDLYKASEITDENEAARLLAGRAACYVTTDKDGHETLRQPFSFRDTFQNRANRIWFDITEKSYVLGCYIMFQYDVIKELANTGRVIVNNSNGETNTITLAA